MSVLITGITIVNLNFTPAATIIGFTLTSISNVSNLTQSDLSFGINFVSVNFQDVRYEQGGSALFTILTLATPTVPEPATLTLLGLGLAAAAFARRRKSN